jgi:hypothetical protein
MVGSAHAELPIGYLVPDPRAARDFALCGSTAALTGSPQSAGINPAGIEIFEPSDKLRATLLLNPASVGLFSVVRDNRDRTTPEKMIDGARLFVYGIGVQKSVLVLTATLSEPVLWEGEAPPEKAFKTNPLEGHYCNSIRLRLQLHPQISVGGCMARVYENLRYRGDAYSYGVILRQKSVAVGVQYQQFPPSGIFSVHPLDHRGRQTTNAALNWNYSELSVSLQVMNLTQKSERAFLEPHAGIEWRPLRAVVFRAGGTQFSRSQCWAWTAGLGLLDANWLRKPEHRLATPDDVLQLATGIIYRKYAPLSMTSTLTLAWRL